MSSWGTTFEQVFNPDLIRLEEEAQERAKARRHAAEGLRVFQEAMGGEDAMQEAVLLAESRRRPQTFGEKTNGQPAAPAPAEEEELAGTVVRDGRLQVPTIGPPILPALSLRHLVNHHHTTCADRHPR